MSNTCRISRIVDAHITESTRLANSSEWASSEKLVAFSRIFFHPHVSTNTLSKSWGVWRGIQAYLLHSHYLVPLGLSWAERSMDALYINTPGLQRVGLLGAIYLSHCPAAHYWLPQSLLRIMHYKYTPDLSPGQMCPREWTPRVFPWREDWESCEGVLSHSHTHIHMPRKVNEI